MANLTFRLEPATVGWKYRGGGNTETINCKSLCACRKGGRSATCGKNCVFADRATSALRQGDQDRRPVHSLSWPDRYRCPMTKYDLILYGATGFTGKLAAKYLSTVPDLRGKQWAIAGRTASKLQELKATLLHPGLDVLTVELTDAAATEQMVASTRAVISCAGPYSQHHGEELLSACARAGVHYSDLAGESWWQAEMCSKYHSVAERSGARIVLGGGVDSIPSDLGTMLALGALPQEALAAEAVKVVGVYTEYSGSFSGGTLNSGRAKNQAKREGVLTDAMDADPYLVCGAGTTGADSTADGMPAGFSWRIRRRQPFFMGAINARIVRRSLALRGLQQRVSYAECSSVGLWARIAWVYASSGMGYFRREPINLKPQSGEGPPAWLIREGAFTIEVSATAASGHEATAVVKGNGDPGYGATAKMLAETGLCLSCLDPPSPHQTGGGVLTPATGLGELLVARLLRAEGGGFMSLDVKST